MPMQRLALQTGPPAYWPMGTCCTVKAPHPPMGPPARPPPHMPFVQAPALARAVQVPLTQLPGAFGRNVAQAGLLGYMPREMPLSAAYGAL